MAQPQHLGGSRYRLRTDAPPDPVTGQRRQLSKAFTGTRREAIEAQRVWEVTHAAIDHAGTSTTFSTLLDRWLAQSRPMWAKATYDAREGVSRLYLKPALGSIPLRQLSTSHFDAFLTEMAGRPGVRGNLLSPTTISLIHDTARMALNQAIRWEWIVRNPASHAQRQGRRAIRDHDIALSPTPEDLDAFLVHLDITKPLYSLFVGLIAATGCRPGEICALRWMDVDLYDLSISINGSMNRYGQRGPTKTRASRTIAITATTRDLLAKHRADLGEPPSGHYLFGGNHPTRPNIISADIGRLRDQIIGLSSTITLRSLRHFHATQLMGAGVDPNTVAKRLGHSNPLITLRVYSSQIRANDRHAAEVIDRIRKI